MPVDVDDPPLPAHLQLEVTSACNLGCVMCLVRYRPPVNKLAGAMPLDLYRRLVDDVPTLKMLTLQGLGEPLLSPYLLDMMRIAVERRIRVGFNSNATLLTGRRSAELVDSRVDWLHVSLDGASAAAYEKIRDNVDELPALVRLLGEIGVDELRVQNLSHSFSDTDPAGRYREIRDFTGDKALWAADDVTRVANAFAEARQIARGTGLRLRLPSLDAADGDGGCSWPWTAAYVTSGGVVQPCCMVMGDDRVVLGRLTERRFPEIWYGAAYREFRRRLAGDEPPEVCRGCSLYHRTF
jgi:radical SAM protein with 4Fe4S-binding SPASM domain